MKPALRLPAEWEPQAAILIAWPHADTDWADRLGEVEDTYIALVAAITRFEPVLICVADDDLQAYARARLASARNSILNGCIRVGRWINRSCAGLPWCVNTQPCTGSAHTIC